MSQKKLRIGFIGTGGIARAQMHRLAKFSDAELIAGADVNAQALEAARKECSLGNAYEDWREMLRKEDLDAVSVCTPNGLHAENSIGALEAGCHVLVEKPLAMNAVEGQAMVDAAKKAGKHLIIAFQWRFHPKTQYLRNEIAAGRFGKVLFMRCSAMRRRGIPNWGVFGRKDLQGGGPLIDIGVHVMEMAHYVMGSPRPVAAVGHTFRYIGDKPCDVACMWPNWDHKTYTVEDLAIGHIRFEDGSVMQVEASFAAHARESWTFSFLAEKGGGDFEDLSVRTDENGYMVDKKPAYLANDDCFDLKMRAFVDTVLHKKPTIADAAEGLDIQKMIDGIYRSAETGKEVSIG